MKPQTISEYMLYGTVRIESNNSTGTGFFFNFTFDNNKKFVPVIITNKHVVNYKKREDVRFFLHTKNGNVPDDEKLDISYTADWFTKGITSSHPAIDFNNKNVGVVDIACFPGSSGSPIFVLNENGYYDKNANTYHMAKMAIFLGVLFSGPYLNAKGELIIENIPTQQKVSSSTRIMINLGFYIKAKEILSFKPVIEKRIS